MGTNYYLRYNICECCNRFDQHHIGKDSSGWKFLFHIDENHKNVNDWLADMRTSKYKIYDEYDEEISYHDFLKIITNKIQNQSRIPEFPKTFTSDGKYDYSDGEFS